MNQETIQETAKALTPAQRAALARLVEAKPEWLTPDSPGTFASLDRRGLAARRYTSSRGSARFFEYKVTLTGELVARLISEGDQKKIAP